MMSIWSGNALVHLYLCDGVCVCVHVVMVVCMMCVRTWWSLQWRHNERDGVSNHQPHDCLLNRLFRRRSKKTPKPASLAFVRGIHRWIPWQMANNAENVSIWWRHHGWLQRCLCVNGRAFSGYLIKYIWHWSISCVISSLTLVDQLNSGWSTSNSACVRLTNQHFLVDSATVWTDRERCWNYRLYMGLVMEVWLSCYLFCYRLIAKTR